MKNKPTERKPMNAGIINQVKTELDELDRELIELDGKKLKPSQCYHFDVNPMHVLFNTNCPESLRQKVQAIFSKYISTDETGAYTADR